MTNDPNWSDVYDYACKAFGQTPRAEDEAVILEAFARNPQHVIRQIDEVANALHDRKIKWAWSSFAGRIHKQEQNRDVTVNHATGRTETIDKATIWMNNAGIHFDRWDECRDELFGDRGRLQPWAEDEALVMRMLTLWEDAHEKGAALDAAAEQRALEWKAHRTKLQLQAKARLEATETPEPEPATT